MANQLHFDVIIIGGSYAGLSAAMALGRSVRNVLIIDGGKPCNAQTPYSHNLITHDGRQPAEITRLAKAQVMKYETVHFYEGIAVDAKKTDTGFEIETISGEHFLASKLIFATGVKDQLPNIPGFAECWGISVIHCPYCHGYEVKHQKTGILANGDDAFEFGKLISNWTKDLTIFTNGKSLLTTDQYLLLQQHQIEINEDEISQIQHQNGQISELVFNNENTVALQALYARVPFSQHCLIPAQLGCELTAQGHLKVDAFQKTTVDGVYACGDNTWPMRSVANAIAAGNFAGAAVNKEMIAERFD